MTASPVDQMQYGWIGDHVRGVMLVEHLDPRIEAGKVQRTWPHHGTAGGKGEHQAEDQPVRMGHRGRIEDPRVGIEAEEADQRIEVGKQVSPGDLHTAWFGRRTRGEDQIGQLVRTVRLQVSRPGFGSRKDGFIRDDACGFQRPDDGFEAA